MNEEVVGFSQLLVNFQLEMIYLTLLEGELNIVGGGGGVEESQVFTKTLVCIIWKRFIIIGVCILGITTKRQYFLGGTYSWVLFIYYGKLQRQNHRNNTWHLFCM